MILKDLEYVLEDATAAGPEVKKMFYDVLSAEEPVPKVRSVLIISSIEYGA